MSGRRLRRSTPRRQGVEVKVVTAAGGNYESTLKSEIAKTDAPTLFQINGPVGYQSWKDYCLDLTDTEFLQVPDRSEPCRCRR